MNTLKFNQIEFNHIGEQPTSSIKLQEKSVTITENGTTEVVPDNGYALEKVKVKVNAIHEYKYYKTTPEFFTLYSALNPDEKDAFEAFIYTIRFNIFIYNYIYGLGDKDVCDAFCVDLDRIIGVRINDVSVTRLVREYLNETIFADTSEEMTMAEFFATLPEITAEEYYNFK